MTKFKKYLSTRITNLNHRSRCLFAVALVHKFAWQKLPVNYQHFLHLIERRIDGDKNVVAEVRHFVNSEFDTLYLLPYICEILLESSNITNKTRSLSCVCNIAASLYVSGVSFELIHEFLNQFIAPCKLDKLPSRQAKELAELIYEEKDWKSLPILADKLEEEGFSDIISGHLRHLGPHYRGWWSLELVLCAN